jgi:hypothetical protein
MKGFVRGNPQDLRKGLGAGGDLPGELNRHPEIIPSATEARQEGVNWFEKVQCSSLLHAEEPSLSLEIGPMETKEYRPMARAAPPTPVPPT